MIYKDFDKGSMYRVVEFNLSCGYCKEDLLSHEYYTQNGFLAYARSLGWSIGNEVKCPKCKGERK